MSENANASQDKLVTDRYESYWINDNTFYIHYFRDVEGNIDDAKDIMAFQISQGVKKQNSRIIHAEKFVTVTKEAREYIEQNAPEVSAEAYIIASLAHKIMFNLYIKFRRNAHPIKAFETLEAALDWVKQH